MNEQILKDFIATAQKYNYNWNTVFSKFPELKKYNQQVLKDYVATAEKYNYDYSVVNSKFPELGFQPVKKKGTTVSPSVPKQQPISSVTPPKGPQKPSVSSVSGKDEGLYKFPGNEQATYKKQAGQWYVDPSGSGKFTKLYKGDVEERVKLLESKAIPYSGKKQEKNVFSGVPGKENVQYVLDTSGSVPVWRERKELFGAPETKATKGVTGGYDLLDKKYKYDQVTDPTRVQYLNKFFKQNGSTSDVDMIYTGFPGKERNQYRIKDNKWQRLADGSKSWQDVTDKNAITALNNQYKKSVQFTTQIEEEKPATRFTDINSNLVSKTEEAVVPYLQKKYSGLGFNFEESGMGTDYVKVTAKNGNTIEVGLDEKNTDEAFKLKSFLEQNQSTKHSSAYNKLLDYGTRIKSVTGNLTFGLSSPEAKKIINELNAYRKSDEYLKDIQNFTFDELESEINSIKKQYIEKGDENGLKNFYNSSVYKAYEQRKDKKTKVQSDKIDALYYELKQAKTPTERKNIKAKVDTFLSDEFIKKQSDEYLFQLNDIKDSNQSLKKQAIENQNKLIEINKLFEQGKITRLAYDETRKQLDYKSEYINSRFQELGAESDALSSNMKKLETVAGKYILAKEKTGNFGGLVLNSFATGVSKILEPLGELMVGYISKEEKSYLKLSPDELKILEKKGYNKEQIKAYAINKDIKRAKNDLRAGIIDVIGTSGTTQEYIKSKDRGFFEAALAGVAESLPGMIVPGGAVTKTAALGLQAYSSIEDEMLNDKDFETTSTAERAIVAVPYAIGMGILEQIGLSKAISKNPLAKSLVTKSILGVAQKIGGDATVEALENALSKEIKSNIAKFGLRIVGGTLAEAETGAAQSLALDIGLKGLYNTVRDAWDGELSTKLSQGEYFDTPDSFAEGLKQVAYDAAAEAVGGMVMTGFTTGYEGLMTGNINLYSDKDIDFLKSLSEDSEMKKIFKAKLKTEMLTGKMTKSEAQSKLDSLNEAEAIFSGIPENIKGKNLKDAFSLVLERNKLTEEIEDKDANLVKPQTDRIAEINNQLKTIGENAVKESTKPVEEVTAEGGGVQYQGTQEGQPEVGQGEGAVGQAAQPEADFGDRAVEGRGVQEERVTSQIVNRPAVLSEFGGKTFDTPLKGDVYVEGQQVIFEDRSTGRMYELGNVDEVMDTQVPGLSVEQERVAITPEGKVSIEGSNWNIQSELPTQGIEYNPAGEVMTVSLKDDAGNTKMFKGQDAVDIAYQIELQKYQTEEQQQFINDLLEQDEEFKAATESIKPAEVAAVVQEEAAPDIVQAQPAAVEETVTVEQPVAEKTIDDLKTLDVTDKTNLQKVQSFLDKLENDLDKFGKETLGVNLPVALAKTIVKAVKALVKAGVTLEKAIKQIANEYNLSDRDVKSLLAPTKVSEIDVNEVRAKARPGKRISKGLSVKTVAGKKVIEETEDLSLDYVKKNAPKVFISNANIIAKYPLVAGKKKFKTATTVEQAQEIYNVFVREVADNLNYLMAEFKPEYREISTLWYDGANAIANDFADQFGVSTEQAAGIIAAMSPQKDWYQNVRLAEMVLMAYKDNPVMTKEMIDYQKGINKIGLYEGAASPGKKLKKAEAEYKKSRTKDNKDALDQAKVKLQEAIDKTDALIAMLEKYIGKNLNDAPEFVQPYMVRTYHEVNTTKDYNIVAPDGSVQGVAKKKDGSKAKVAWGSYSEIGKAVAIKNDGSQENITRSLGEMHKIRNFYNNIIDPMSKDGDVTMDTHAIAAALLLPLSGNSTQVGQNFGAGTANSGPLGIKGLYYAYADAYDLSAKESGLLPRQVQSITWEAIRGLYTDTFKSNKNEVAKINNIWKEYQDGKITIDEARKQAKESAGGIKDPTWAGPVQTEFGEGTGTQGVEGRGDGNERDTVGGTDGGRILTADTKKPSVLKRVESALDKADNDLAKFGKETLGINIPVATMRAIIKIAKTLVKTGITLQDAIIKAAEQLNVSKEDALNAVKFMSQTINRQPKAPSVAKILGKPAPKKITVNEATALKDQLRLEARAARESTMDLKRKQRTLVALINSMKRQGLISTNQATALAKRIVNTNVDNPVMVNRMLDYAERIFKDAEYKSKLSNARSNRKKIKAAIKNASLQGTVVSVAKEFASIDPRLIEDIDAYNAYAEVVLDAVGRKQLPDTRTAMKFSAILDYAERAKAEMEIYLEQEMNEVDDIIEKEISEMPDIEGMTASEIKDLIESLKGTEEVDVSEAKKQLIREYLKKLFNEYKPVIQEELRDADMSEKSKELMTKLMGINLAEIDLKEAVKIIDAIQNFITNGITDNVESIVKTYEGQKNAREVESKNIPTRKAKLKLISKNWQQYMMSFPMLTEWIFKTPERAIYILDKMGISSFTNGIAKATKTWTKLVDSYYDMFKKKKANGKDFMDVENVYERQMYADLKRTVAKDEAAKKEELDRKIKLLNKSVEVLRTMGDDTDAKKADVYEKLINKLGLNNSGVTIESIEDKVDSVNKDAVNWWIDAWAGIYDKLSDISKNVYNTVLEKELFYTPMKFSTLKAGISEEVEAEISKMGGGSFAMSMNYVYDKKSGSLMPSTKPASMETGRYVDLDFDINNSRALKAALIDIETAAATKQIKAFIGSKSMLKIIEDKNERDLFENRLSAYILASRNKSTPTDEKELSELEKAARVWASLGATRALGGLTQSIKQTVPVLTNTLLNTVTSFSLISNKEQWKWIDGIGMPISNRGQESLASFESAEEKLESNIGKTAASKTLKKIEAINSRWLKWMLSNPDVYAARSSFIAYYKQALRAKGLPTNIDFSRPEDANKEALNYAQHMIDRQQDVSDLSQKGTLFSGKSPTLKFIKNVFFPFMSFNINQKSRMVADMSRVSAKGVSNQDRLKATKSLFAAATEMATFHAISFAIRYYLIKNIALLIMGDEEDEEEDKKYRNRQLGYAIGSVARDVLSPIPLTDYFVDYGTDYILSNMNIGASEDDAKKSLDAMNQMRELKGDDPLTGEKAKEWMDKYIEEKRVSVKTFDEKMQGGMYSITVSQFKDLYDSWKLAFEGEYEQEGFNGKPMTKYVNKSGQEELKDLFYYQALHTLIGFPSEAGAVMKRMETSIKKENSLTEKQKEAETEILKKYNKNKLNDLELELVKKFKGTTTQSGSERVIEELDWIRENGGIKGEKQIKRYIKVLEEKGEVMYDDLKRIQTIK